MLFQPKQSPLELCILLLEMGVAKFVLLALNYILGCLFPLVFKLFL